MSPPESPTPSISWSFRANDTAALDHWLAGRVYEPLFLYESQGLEVYRVYARQ